MFTGKNSIVQMFIIVTLSLSLSACGFIGNLANPLVDLVDPTPTLIPTTEPTPVATMESQTRGALEMIQDGFSNVYAEVLPSVVNIQVVQKVEQGLSPDMGELPFGFPFQFPDNGGEFSRSGLGSGFVWDKEGHIITNNHVVENADDISVTFQDGTSVDGKVIGADRDSDLAVVKVDYPKERLQPIKVADSTQVQVGQLAAAIGNPFGLQGTMTIGVISALGRSLPVGSNVIQGSSYTIPDVIQTDAPINPGNSGGVLVDMDARLIGVPTAIESSSGVNAGVGFVIPSVIVEKVVPALIEDGYFEHPWIGISGTTLNSDLAEKMDLNRDQRGVLVMDIVPDSPADQAGLVGSDRLVSIDEQDVRLGGDVIIQIGSQATQDFEDLTAYLARNTTAGQTITLTVLRDGKQETLDLTLGVRPAVNQAEVQEARNVSEGAWLGISGLTMAPQIAEAMNLPIDQTGVLIQQVVEDSPAEEAGLRGSYKSIVINEAQVLVGGDVIVALDGEEIIKMDDLQLALQEYNPNDEINLTILRDGDSQEVQVILGTNP